MLINIRFYHHNINQNHNDQDYHDKNVILVSALL